MLTFFLSLFCGFLITISASNGLAATVFLVLACMFYMPLLFLPWLIPSTRNGEYESLCYDEPMFQKLVKQHRLVLWITFTMPLFPLTYLLAAVRVINQEQSAMVFITLSMLIKGIYAAVLMDLNADALVTYKWRLRLELGANDSRRAFMKYIFHEVRTPLNSISMGIDILEQSAASASVSRDPSETLVILPLTLSVQPYPTPSDPFYSIPLSMMLFLLSFALSLSLLKGKYFENELVRIRLIVSLGFSGRLSS